MSKWKFLLYSKAIHVALKIVSWSWKCLARPHFWIGRRIDTLLFLHGKIYNYWDKYCERLILERQREQSIPRSS